MPYIIDYIGQIIRCQHSRKGYLLMQDETYLCEPCGYVYDPIVGDPDGGVTPGTAFEDLPDTWVCPVCGLGKDAFVSV